MNIHIHGKTEEMVHAAIASGRFGSVEEFIEAMAIRWQSEHHTIDPLVQRIDINDLVILPGDNVILR